MTSLALAFALALAAALLDVTVGYPAWLARRIGSPESWLLAWLAMVRGGTKGWKGRPALLVYLAPALVASALVVQLLPAGPIGFALAALLTSSLCSRQSLNRRAGAVAEVWEADGAYEAFAAIEALGGEEGETRLAPAGAAAIAARFAEDIAALTVFTALGGLVGAALCRAATLAARHARASGDVTPLGVAALALEAFAIAPAARWGAVLLAAAAAMGGARQAFRAVAGPAPRPGAPAERVTLSALGDPLRDDPAYIRRALALMRRAAALEMAALAALALGAAFV